MPRPGHLFALPWLLLPILVSCGKPAGLEETPAPLMLGTNVWPGYEPLYLARELDYFSEHAIRLVEYSSATQVIQAFRNGAVQAAALTLDEALLLRQNQIDARVVLINDISDGSDVILGRGEIRTLADLRGKRVGVENTALGAFFLARALQLGAIARDEIQLVTLEVDEHVGAFQNGSIDAVVTFEPVRSALLREGASLLFDSSQIPGEIVDVIVVRQQDIPVLQPHLQQLINGWYRALDYLESSPDDACGRMARRLGISPEEVRQSFEGIKLPSRGETLDLLQGSHPKLVNTAASLLETMQQTGVLNGKVDITNLVNTDPLASTATASATTQ
jgi:NitT/TauT family transport system substrate-binding protein